MTELLAAWSSGTKLGESEFADRFFGRAADDPVAEKLHSATRDIVLATSHADLREAAEKTAGVIQALGLDRWPRFLVDALERARDPTTVSAIEKSGRVPDPIREAIRPVYPIETAIEVAAAGIAGGAVAAVRAVGGAILKQVLPEKHIGTPVAAETAPRATSPTTAAETPPISRQKQDGHIDGTPQNLNRVKQGTPTSTFDGSSAEADALTREAWEKGSSVPDRSGVRDYDFGRRIGRAPNGKSQSTVRVHQDSAGRLHGHPSGRGLP